MATVDTSVNELIINKLTQAQYDALTEKSPTELYFVTDAKEPLQVVDTVENFPACTVEDLGKLVLYIGPTTDSTEESVQLILDSKIINGHIFGVVEQTIAISETESETIYMWKDVYESLPTIEDSVTGKVLSNNGLYPEWVDMPGGISEIAHDTTLSGSGTEESPLKVTDDTYLPLSGGTLTGPLVAPIKTPNYYTTATIFSVRVDETAKTGTPITFQATSWGDILTLSSQITADGCSPLKTTSSLGGPFHVWDKVYTKKINNGSNITVPNKAGTMALIEDINETVGDISTALTAILGE